MKNIRKEGFSFISDFIVFHSGEIFSSNLYISKNVNFGAGVFLYKYFIL